MTEGAKTAYILGVDGTHHNYGGWLSSLRALWRRFPPFLKKVLFTKASALHRTCQDVQRNLGKRVEQTIGYRWGTKRPRDFPSRVVYHGLGLKTCPAQLRGTHLHD
jgi:hypothetical protein